MNFEGRRQRYWPGHWLVPSIDVLRTQLAGDIEDDPERHRRRELELEQLPYCLGATCYAFFELVTTQNLTVTLDLAKPGPRGGIHVLRPYERDRMAFLVDSTLEAARRAQNALILYVNRARHVNLPASMGRAVDRLKDDQQLLAGPIRDSLLAYWDSHGSRLKDYRDLSQHYALVSSDARTFVSSDGIPSIYLVLPNNPEERRLAALRYEPPYVHAVLYLHVEFVELVKLCNLVCEALLDRSKSVRVALGQPLKGPITLGQPLEGNPIVTVERVAQVFHQHLKNLRPPIGL